MPKNSEHQRNKRQSRALSFRFWLLRGLILLAFLGLIARLVQLTIGQADFLRSQSQARSIRVVSIPAYRGMITDRSGQPLAVSTPMISVWANPQMVHASLNQLNQLAKTLDIPLQYLKQWVLRADPHRQFVWLKRGLPPEKADEVKALHLNGVFFKKEYRRFYPQGPTAAQVIGFTNIDQKGQEGIELLFNDWLAGQPGKQRVVIDRLGHVIATLDTLSLPHQGKSITLSLDYRIQYLAYQSLKQAVKKYQAESGSAIVLDPKTGEVLAMANAPSFNPNSRPKTQDSRYRNRAVTDMYEPGSTIKAFSLLAALASRRYQPNTIVDTNPGRIRLNGHEITDENINYGRLPLTEILQKSSNIGVAKIMQHLPTETILRLFQKFGFGMRSQSGFPGESPGKLPTKPHLNHFERATLGFGYGIATTPLQLVHAYATIANHGRKVPVTFLKRDQEPNGESVVAPHYANQMIHMLETVTKPGGTGRRAAIPGYQVAGKTATSRLLGPQGYYGHRYVASFVGFVPAENARLAIIVVLRDPRSHTYFGGLIAAPVFARIARNSLNILNVPPVK